MEIKQWLPFVSYAYDVKLQLKVIQRAVSQITYKSTF